MEHFIKKIFILLSFFNCFHAAVTTITQSGSYLIGADLIATPTVANDIAILISASDVTLDMGNHLVTQMPGNLQPGFDAIVIETGLSDVTIKNAHVLGVSGVGIHVYDGCTNIGILDSKIEGCNTAGIFFDGSATGIGIIGASVNNCSVSTCTGAGGSPAYGIRMAHGLLGKVINSYIAFNDAGITAPSYGISMESWCAFQIFNSIVVGGGGTNIVAGLSVSQSYTGIVDDTIFYKGTCRDLTATGTVCGVLLDQATDILITKCKCSSNINNQMASFGFLAQNGSQNVFRNCLSEINLGGGYAAGFKFSGEQRSSIIDCIIQDQKTVTSGTAYGVIFTDTCDKCQIIHNEIFNNIGASSSFGIKDERPVSTSAIVKNYAFNNGTNYSVTYTTGVTLPVLSASLSSASPGIPSGTGGILDNIDITP
jgi:hypothetical protein